MLTRYIVVATDTDSKGLAGRSRFEPARVVQVRRAVEQGARGPAALRVPKNGKVRTSIFPKSLAADLRDLVRETEALGGSARSARMPADWLR